ncbi:hypothetical protein PFLUV_G00228500 [Perca fluviatilis]|uniref:Uncharacterized protein n=1 Tax=Perca fluviatilis TaxID=8168 RepID=A0A6A5DQI4_PERFL|nr:hypothetical protein PFLUV_G00228500 [Perca fluviatilis]
MRTSITRMAQRMDTFQEKMDELLMLLRSSQSPPSAPVDDMMLSACSTVTKLQEFDRSLSQQERRNKMQLFLTTLGGSTGEFSVTGEEGDVDDDTELPPPPSPQDCSSPVPSASVSSRQARRGKRQGENEELLEYMEKADDKFLQLNKDMTAKMETNTSTLLGLMARMVAVMEAQAKK